MQGNRAHRNDFQVHSEPVDEPVQALEEELESENERLIADYASLKDHPGWKVIKKDFEDTIASYRSGRYLQQAIKSGKSVEDIGKLTMTSNAVADELEKIVLTVETAAAQVEEKKSRGRAK